jgi:hypothetical protein
MTKYYDISVMSPKNGKAGVVRVATKFEFFEDTIAPGDDEETVGRRIARLLVRHERGAFPPPTATIRGTGEAIEEFLKDRYLRSQRWRPILSTKG